MCSTFQAQRLSQLASLCLLLVILALSGVAYAEQDISAVLALEINKQPQGEINARLRGTDILVPLSALEAAELTNLQGTKEDIQGVRYVSLVSLAPTITYTLDQVDLTLSVTATTDHLPHRTMNYQAANRPSSMRYAGDTSAFINYSVTGRDLSRAEAFAEGGVRIGPGLLQSSATLTAQGQLVRNLTSFYLDDQPCMCRWMLGDMTATTGNLGASALLGGLGFTRNYALDPYFMSYPTVGLSGTVLTPSTMEVYVNGLLVRREQVMPGTLNLTNIPAAAGSGSTRIVIRDIYGNTQEVGQAYYLAPRILKQGLHDFGYYVGLQRYNFGVESADYRANAFAIRHQYGLTNRFTIGGRLEADPRLVNLGSSLGLASPVGEFQVDMAVSQHERIHGAAASINYLYRTVGFSAGAGMTAQTAGYSNLSLLPTYDRALTAITAFVSIPVTHTFSVMPEYTRTYWRDRGLTDRLGLLSTVQLSKKLILTMNANTTTGQEGRDYAAFVGLTYLWDARTVATLGHQQTNGRMNDSLTINRSLPPDMGPGFGYMLRGNTNTTAGQDGVVQYQNGVGRYEASVHEAQGQTSTALTASGSLVLIGGRAHATRAVQDGYALVQVPGVEGVRGYLNNVEMGRTDRHGDLLVPRLMPYYGNRISIADEDIPLTHGVDEREHVIAPPYRGGAIVAFPVYRLQRIVGHVELVVNGAHRIPAYGEFELHRNGTVVTSPIGQKGNIYLENIPAGTYPATVTHDGQPCHFTVTIPDRDEALVKLPTMSCRR